MTDPTPVEQELHDRLMTITRTVERLTLEVARLSVLLPDGLTPTSYMTTHLPGVSVCVNTETGRWSAWRNGEALASNYTSLPALAHALRQQLTKEG